MTQNQILLSFLLLLTAVVAWVDWRTGHIPNRLLGFGAVIGLGVRLACAGLGRHGAELAPMLVRAGVDSAFGVVVCALVPLLLFKLGAMGGGDVKLLALVGLVLGPLLGIQLEFAAFIAIALYAPAQLAYRGELLRLLANTAALAQNPFLPRARRREVPPTLLTSLPFGPAVLVATLLLAAADRWLA